MHEVVSQPFYKIGSEEGENAIMQRNVKKIYRILMIHARNPFPFIMPKGWEFL